MILILASPIQTASAMIDVSETCKCSGKVAAHERRATHFIYHSDGTLTEIIRKAFRAGGLRFSATGGPAYGWQVSGFRLPALPMSRY